VPVVVHDVFLSFRYGVGGTKSGGKRAGSGGV
jgi:hypothetical protein